MRSSTTIFMALFLVCCGCSDKEPLRPPEPVTRTWKIAPDGGGDFTTIQPAIEVAQSGDTLMIGSGTYSEAVQIDGRTLVLIGTGPEACFLEHHHVAQPGDRALTIRAGANVVISGLHVTQHLTACSNGIVIEDASVTLETCALIKCGLTARESTVDLAGCTIYANCDYECDTEIYLIEIYGGAAELTRNVIAGGNRYGLFCDESPQVSLACNDCWGHVANYAGCLDPTGGGGNISADPRFVDPSGDDFHLLPDSPCLGGPECAQMGAFGASPE